MNINNPYFVNYLKKSLYHVDEFESYNDKGEKKYDCMIIKNFFSYRPDYRKKVALILVRANKDYRFEPVAISKLFKHEYYTFDSFVLSYLKEKRVLDQLGKNKIVKFTKDNAFYIKAQGSSDRKGFYKEWRDGDLISEKNYGDCSYIYKIVGLKIYDL